VSEAIDTGQHRTRARWRGRLGRRVFLGDRCFGLRFTGVAGIFFIVAATDLVDHEAAG
jgi:hypothetical protein